MSSQSDSQQCPSTGEDIKNLGRARLIEILGDTEAHRRMTVCEMRAMCRTNFPTHRKKRTVREWATPDRDGEEFSADASAAASSSPLPPFPVVPQFPTNLSTVCTQHRQHDGPPQNGNDVLAEGAVAEAPSQVQSAAFFSGSLSFLSLPFFLLKA